MMSAYVMALRGAIAFSLLVPLAGCGGGSHAAAPQAKSIALPPANPVAVATMVQGVQAAKDGQRDRAVALLRNAIAADANLWEARFDLGVVLTTANDLAGAEGELATAARLSPDVPEVAVTLAEVRRRRGEHKRAAEGLSDFVQGHPNAVEVRVQYVAALRQAGQIDKAIGEAREVLVRKPSDASALAELALSHLARGEKEAAGLLAKQALDSNPNSAIAHRATGLLDLTNGDDALAFAEFRKAAQADPADTTSRLNMGVVLLKAGVYTKAADQYREILKLAPDDVDAQVGLAAALRGESDASHPQYLEQAKTLLEKVVAASPHQTNALFNMGVLYADFLKKPGEAAGYFQRFLADAPGDDPLRADAEKFVSAAAASGASTAPAGQAGASPTAPGAAAPAAPATPAAPVVPKK
jgi:tetratricopeptide (TPR) repeat protein